jgi:hypothetical protein
MFEGLVRYCLARITRERQGSSKLILGPNFCSFLWEVMVAHGFLLDCEAEGGLPPRP